MLILRKELYKKLDLYIRLAILTILVIVSIPFAIFYMIGKSIWEAIDNILLNIEIKRSIKNDTQCIKNTKDTKC